MPKSINLVLLSISISTLINQSIRRRYAISCCYSCLLAVAIVVVVLVIVIIAFNESRVNSKQICNRCICCCSTHTINRVLHKKLLEANTSTIGYIHRTPTKSPARTSISPITMSSKVLPLSLPLTLSHCLSLSLSLLTSAVPSFCHNLLWESGNTPRIDEADDATASSDL